MSDNTGLLSRIRELNWLISESQVGYVSFDELCQALAEMLEANVYVISRSGKVLAAVRKAGGGNPIVETEERMELPKESTDKVNRIQGSKVNITFEEVKELYGDEYADKSKYHMIQPVTNCGNRLATLLVARPDVMFSEEDVVLLELSATIVGMEVAKGLDEEEKSDLRYREAVRMAIDKLSYSELSAVKKLFAELKEDDIVFVASKIADKYKITRSVIVNALRKFESAGVIESRSLGMKGTRIKVTNPFLRDQIDEIEI